MITTGRAAYQAETRYAEYAGLSTDNKMDNEIAPFLSNGDIFKEIDTGNVFRFNEDTRTWVLQPAQGGGGGGGVAGVTSFNGRQGVVLPQAGDYTAEQVGALPLAGDLVSGNLVISGNPGTQTLDLSDVNYIDGSTVSTDSYIIPLGTTEESGDVNVGLGLVVQADIDSTIGGGGDGITQDQADARYLQLAGGTMSGNIDMGGNNLDNVSYVKAAGTYKNAGIQFSSNGTIMNFVTGYSTALELSANNVNVVNHSIDNVGELNMITNGNITSAGLVGGNVEQNNKTCIDFTTANSVGVWAEGLERVIIDTNGVNVNGNKITNVDSIVAEGSAVENIKFESDGAIVGIICEGTRSATFTASAIDAYDHTISRVGEPLNDTDAARKVDVDTVANTVNDIIDGTEAIPYLPENGGTLSGPLNMGNNKITMGGTPTVNTDVTNKGYVDGVVKVVSDEVDGILAGTTPVAIPVATEVHVGGIKPGPGVSVSEDGTLTISVPVPTEADNGKILVVQNGQYVLTDLAATQG